VSAGRGLETEPAGSCSLLLPVTPPSAVLRTGSATTPCRKASSLGSRVIGSAPAVAHASAESGDVVALNGLGFETRPYASGSIFSEGAAC
jgi:hypothetical protein